MEVNIKIIVKWSGKEYDVELTENDTVNDLKNAIQKATGVRPERQKLLNLKFKGTFALIKNNIIIVRILIT